MGQHRDVYQLLKKSRNQLQSLFNDADNTLIVHYSCESFYDRKDMRSPRITSIAVRNLESGQTKSFSIHLLAERRKLLDSIDEHYDQLEKEMLEDFYSHVGKNQHATWLHWNMRDANFGFEALENRLLALGGIPSSGVADAKKVDLSRLLVGLYGKNYAGHPRIDSLMQQNGISAKDFLVGAAEAEAFVMKNFLALHQSTLRKVDVFANFASMAHAGTLKTKGTWWEKNGRSFKAAGEWLREHWFISGIVAILTVVFAVIKLLRLFL